MNECVVYCVYVFYVVCRALRLVCCGQVRFDLVVLSSTSGAHVLLYCCGKQADARHLVASHGFIGD